MDLYGAYNGTYKDFGYGVSVIQYRYPQDDTLNWVEYAVSGSYKMFTVKYNTSSDVFGTSTSANYVEAAADFEVAKGVGLGVHVGHYKFDDETVFPSYTDYSVSLSKDNFSFTISDTNLDSTYIDSKTKFYVGYTKSFDF